MTFKISDYFDQVYCLNLDRRSDRMERVQKRFEHFGMQFKRIAAVDGSMMSDEEYKNHKLFKKKISKGELACAIGHERIYRDALENGYERILVFEDDARFVSNFLDRIQEMKQLDWDLVLLGCSQFGTIPKVKNGFYHANGGSYCTFAYAATIDCCKKLLDWIEKGGHNIADHLTIRYFNSNKNKCFVYFPNICTMEVQESDLGHNADQKDYDKRVKWNLIKEDII
jgi:GR25 family glycosyltransferase involved in LPS biosynthesis